MDWKVRYVNYPKQFADHEEEYIRIIRSILESGNLIMRGELESFEKNLAAFCETRHAVGVSNCTDALFLSLYAAGVKQGDEVITVSHTFVATAAAAHHLGARPVLVDIADDHNMNVDLVEKAITSRTKAIIPVHLNGRICASMECLVEFADKHGIVIIEDAAQALGASCGDRKAGSFGLAGCFSFYPAKLLGAFGDGGAVVTSDGEFAEKVRALRNHGRRGPEISEWSFNCRMDNLQAAVLDYKLGLLQKWIERRREVALLYHDMLRGINSLKLPPPPIEDIIYSYHYDVFQNYEIEAADRDGLMRHLNGRGIEVMLPWGGKGLHHHPVLGLTDARLPRTDELFRKVLMLPMYPELEDGQVEYVAECVKEFYNGR